MSYTGARVRSIFLRELLADGLAPSFIVTSYGVGDVTDAAFVASLAVAPTVVVGYNPTHAIHQHDAIQDSRATLIDFSTLVFLFFFLFLFFFCLFSFFKYSFCLYIIFKKQIFRFEIDLN